jgi:hypothetical protein
MDANGRKRVAARKRPDDPAITEDQWISAARQHFSGQVILGKDLLEL